MKRSGAELPLCTWSGCGGRLNWVAVATVKRGGGGGAPHCVLSRCASIINGTACCLPAVLPRTLDANLRGAACGASLWAAECGMHDIWPCGGVRLREMRVEGHGSPRAINKCALLLCCFRSFYSSAAIPERSPTPLHYPLYTYTRASSHAPRVLVASAPCSRPTTTPPTTTTPSSPHQHQRQSQHRPRTAQRRPQAHHRFTPEPRAPDAAVRRIERRPSRPPPARRLGGGWASRARSSRGAAVGKTSGGSIAGVPEAPSSPPYVSAGGSCCSSAACSVAGGGTGGGPPQ
jgi:hypothetical protein